MGTNFTYKITLAAMLLLLPINLMGAEKEFYSENDKLAIVDFVEKGFLSYVGKYPGHWARGNKRVEYLIETFGEPIKTDKLKKEHWREPGLIRDHVTRYFDGVIIETSTQPGGKNFLIEAIKVITLENPEYVLYKDIKIGMPFSEFAERLTLKDKKIRNNSITYYVGMHLGSLKSTIFVSSKGKIKKVVWDYLEER